MFPCVDFLVLIFFPKPDNSRSDRSDGSIQPVTYQPSLVVT